MAEKAERIAQVSLRVHHILRVWIIALEHMAASPSNKGTHQTFLPIAMIKSLAPAQELPDFAIGFYRVTSQTGLYVFLMRPLNLRNRNLTRRRRIVLAHPTGETAMSDLIFLALGCGMLCMLALYAHALDRL